LSLLGLAMPQSLAPPTVEDDRRLPLVLNVLWAAGAETDSAAAKGAFRAAAGAARRALDRWQEFYRPPALARLVFPLAEPPAPAILAAAEAEGLAVEPRGGEGAACDVVIVAARDFARLAPGTPALIVAPGEPPRLAVRAAAGLDHRPGRRGEVEATPEALAEALLAPPRATLERRRLRDYQGEDVAERPLRVEYELLLDLIGAREGGSGSGDDAWDRAAAVNAAASVDRGATLAALRAEYERADALALAYGLRWRSALAARSFLLFVVNLICGLIGNLFPAYFAETAAAQAAVTAVIFVDQRRASSGRWRAKWIDYRRAAETTRIARFCALVGAPPPAGKPPSWIDWRVERIMRRDALPEAPAEADAAAILAHLRGVEIDRQIAYHHGAHRRFRRLDVALKQAATIASGTIFGIGALLAVLAVAKIVDLGIPVLGAVGLALIAAPGLSAVLNGLRGQLDVDRQAERSARVGVALRGLRRALGDAPPNAALARAAAMRAAEIMRDDVSSWDRVMEVV
jgi:hypothetical protein